MGTNPPQPAKWPSVGQAMAGGICCPLRALLQRLYAGSGATAGVSRRSGIGARGRQGRRRRCAGVTAIESTLPAATVLATADATGHRTPHPGRGPLQPDAAGAVAGFCRSTRRTVAGTGTGGKQSQQRKPPIIARTTGATGLLSAPAQAFPSQCGASTAWPGAATSEPATGSGLAPTDSPGMATTPPADMRCTATVAAAGTTTAKRAHQPG